MKIIFIPNEGVTVSQLDDLRFQLINYDPASEYIPAITAAIVRMQFPAREVVHVVIPVEEPVVIRELRLIGETGD